MKIKNLKTQLEDANIKLQRIDALENQVKELEASLAAKATSKLDLKKVKNPRAKKGIKKINATKKAVKKSKTAITKTKEKNR